jgi:hypothetical protein
MSEESRDPHFLAPGRAPTPFTADEIRAGCPAGRTTRLRVEVVGEAAFHRLSRFVECDEAGATLERSRLSLDGSVLSEPEVDRVTWRGLQGHASFAADDTTIEADRIETAIGELDCLRYTVREGTTDEVFWFAKDLPGLPIHCLTRTDGRVATTVSVVEDTSRGVVSRLVPSRLASSRLRTSASAPRTSTTDPPAGARR